MIDAAGVQWVRADEAARLLGVTVTNLHVIAHRQDWWRRKDAGVTRYLLADAMDERTRRDRMATLRGTP